MSPFLASLLLLGSTWAVENVQIQVGDGSSIPQGTVVVHQGVITVVGTDIKLSPKTRRIDGTGKILTPGFIETQSQLGLTEVSAVNDTNDHSDSQSSISPAFRAGEGFNPLSVRIPINRLEGVTGALISPKGGIISGTGSYVELSGDFNSRPDTTRPTAMSGSIDARANRAAGGSRGSLWLKLRQLFEDARFYARNQSAVDRGESRPLLHHPTQLRAMLPVLKGQIPLVLNVHRASDILSAIEFAAREKIRLIVSGATEAWLVAKALAASKTPVILRPSKQQPWGFDALAARDDLANRLHQAGVTLVISAGGWDQNARRIRQEAGIAVARGLPWATALQAITQTPATIFGLGAETGTIEAGKTANLVLWTGDPLEIQSSVSRLWIQGRPQPLDDRQLKLARRYHAPAAP
jgi:imidazolonepropionase-like amidohydrolase